MSEKLCTLRTQGGGGGAKQTETVLWTNSAPTSTFNAQTVTLSDSVRNYDYLKFVYNLNNENQTTCSTIMSVSDFVNTKYQAGYFVGEFGCMATTSGTLYPWSRPAHYDTDTTIAIKNCITAGTSVTINTRLIPTAIIGIKNMGGIRTNEKYDYVPFTDKAGGQTLTWNTKGRAKAVWIIMGVKDGVDYIRTNVNPSTGELDDTNVYYYNDNTSGASPTIQSGVSITITDNTVSTNAFSSSTRRFALIYTY